jgi:RNA polymerase sigma-70 factor (ECF subfamily)
VVGVNTTSVSLLERVRQPHDQLSWERFVFLYTPLLLGWAHKLGAKGPDAQDLVQEVFGLLVRTLPTFNYRPHLSFRGWLWRVTFNKWSERQRRGCVDPVSLNGMEDCLASEVINEIAEQEYRQYLVQRAAKLILDEFHPITWQAFWACTNERN